MLVWRQSKNPSVYVSDWNGSSWVTRSTSYPTTPDTSYKQCALSGNGLVIAIRQNSSPWSMIYDWNGSSWSARPAISPQVAGTGRVHLSTDGSVLAIAHDASPYVRVFDWDGSAWSERPIIPDASGNVSMSSSGNTLVFPNKTYDWDGSAWNLRTALGNTHFIGTPYISKDGSRGMMGLSGGRSIAFNYQPIGIEIEFATAPEEGSIITADYTVLGIHKTDQRVIDISGEIQFGEPT